MSHARELFGRRVQCRLAIIGGWSCTSHNSTYPAPTCKRAQCVFSCSTAPERKVSQAAIMTLMPFCSSQ